MTGKTKAPSQPPEGVVSQYILSPDEGDPFCWERVLGRDSRYSLCGDCCGWNGSHPISEELFEALVEWYRRFCRAPEVPGLMTNLDLDWIDFHAQGLELARRLKAEVGPTAEVRYCKPMEDPNQKLEPLRYVLDDGSVVAEESEEPGEQEPWPARQIHAGGQTGADRAALDWAIAYRIIHGGWCPKGRKAEDGPLAGHYQLRETDSAGYRQRTKLNVLESDATLIVNFGELDGGTLETVRIGRQHQKPVLVLQLDETPIQDAAVRLRTWVEANRFGSLNIAGPRESKRPGIYAATHELLERSLEPDGSLRPKEVFVWPDWALGGDDDEET